MKRWSLLLAGLAAGLTLVHAARAELSADLLEKEHLARYSINYANYLIDVGKYLEALESYETAGETTTRPKTRAEALLAEATLLASFLDAPQKALEVYRRLPKVYPPAAESALYRQSLLLFELERFDEARAILAAYRQRYPGGRYRFQAETLQAELPAGPSGATPQPPKPPVVTPPAVAKKHPQVRVRVAYTRGAARISGKQVSADGQKGKDSFTLQVKDNRLLMDGVAVPGNRMTFTSPEPLHIRYGDARKCLRGDLVARIKSGRLLVNNVLDIEDYLRGVVPAENYASWPMETLKAQAVAARTYAYYQMRHRRKWSYDLVDFAGDQAYGGVTREHPRSTKAVRATAGEVLTSQGKPILAMFTANSGGHTADARAIFDLGKPYLSAHRDPASLKGKMADWKRNFSRAEVVRALAKINVRAEGLSAIEAAERGPSGRVVKVRLVLADGRAKVLRNRTTLRRALDLPEILYDIRREGDQFIFEGHGWGHGVGYSQWGASILGKTKGYREILAFYYGIAKPDKLW